jgi:hypothetical protein
MSRRDRAPPNRSTALPGFTTVLAVCPGQCGEGSVLAIAESMARLAGAPLVEAAIPTATAIRHQADQERAGVVESRAWRTRCS